METFLWVEKHRPSTINDCILPENLKKTFKDFVEDKHVPNLILSGGPGVGKTTVAKAMLDEIGATSLNLPFVGSWKNFTRTVDSFLLVITRID